MSNAPTTHCFPKLAGFCEWFKSDLVYLVMADLNFSSIAFLADCHIKYGGHGRNESRQSSNTMKAYANGSILRQYFFDANYFHLLLGLRSFQKSTFLKLTILIFQYFFCQN